MRESEISSLIIGLMQLPIHSCGYEFPDVDFLGCNYNIGKYMEPRKFVKVLADAT